MLVLVAVGAWLAWRYLPLIGVTSARDVHAKCSTEAAMEVTVRGRVESPKNLPLSDHALFKVVDDSGAIWVLARREAPPAGETMRVSGRTFSAANVGKSCTESGLGEGVCDVLAGAARFLSADACVLVEDEPKEGGK